MISILYILKTVVSLVISISFKKNCTYHIYNENKVYKVKFITSCRSSLKTWKIEIEEKDSIEHSLKSECKRKTEPMYFYNSKFEITDYPIVKDTTYLSRIKSDEQVEKGNHNEDENEKRKIIVKALRKNGSYMSKTQKKKIRKLMKENKYDEIDINKISYQFEKRQEDKALKTIKQSEKVQVPKAKHRPGLGYRNNTTNKGLSDDAVRSEVIKPVTTKQRSGQDVKSSGVRIQNHHLPPLEENFIKSDILENLNEQKSQPSVAVQTEIVSDNKDTKAKLTPSIGSEKKQKKSSNASTVSSVSCKERSMNQDFEAKLVAHQLNLMKPKERAQVLSAMSHVSLCSYKMAGESCGLASDVIRYTLCRRLDKMTCTRVVRDFATQLGVPIAYFSRTIALEALSDRCTRFGNGVVAGYDRYPVTYYSCAWAEKEVIASKKTANPRQ